MIQGIIVLSVFLVIYSSLVAGTYKKLKDNGFNTTGSAKMKIPLIPIFTFYMHIRFALRNYKKNRRNALLVLKMGILKYPVALGMLMEVMLEEHAEEICNNEKTAKSRKTKIVKSEVRKRKPLKVTNITKESDIFIKEYWSMFPH
ncbi:hypothetical protein ACQKML_13695 [Peribacillus frigoritolerans]